MNINEIAQLAEVSRATVSRYLNNGYVSEEKKKRIQKVIAQTGYKPSMQAQMLRTKKTRQVGVIIPKINSTSISRMVAGISTVLKEAGFQMLLADTENSEKEELEYLHLFAENQVDGIVLITTIFTPEHKRAMKALRVPVVVLGQRLEGYCCVYQDDYGAGYRAAQLLLADAKKVGCIGVAENERAIGAERKNGFLDAMKKNGKKWDESRYVESGFSAEGGYQAARELLTRQPDLDAVFIATDTVALGAMAWMKESGRRIPEDVALVGIGDTLSAQFVTPSLSSIHFYYKASGQEAAKMLLELMDGKKTVKEVKMGFRAQVRESTRGNAVKYAVGDVEPEE